MLVRSLCGLIGMSILGLAASTGADGAKVVNTADNIEAVMRHEDTHAELTAEGHPRHMEVGPHGSLIDVSKKAQHIASAPEALFKLNKDPEEDDEEKEDEDEDSGNTTGPTVMGFSKEKCNEKDSMGGFVMAKDADLSVDHCISVKASETLAPAGRIKFSCDESGAARVCVYHQVNDTECDMTEPFCMNVDAKDGPLVSTGICLPVKESPEERDTFVQFVDFGPDIKWPNCLSPPMSQMDAAFYGVGGVFCGIIFNMCIWQACLAPKHKDDHHGKHDDGYGEHQGEFGGGGGKGFDGGKGEFGGGKGFGGKF